MKDVSWSWPENLQPRAFLVAIWRTPPEGWVWMGLCGCYMKLTP